LLVLSAHKGIVVLRMDGTSETEFKLGGRQPEGMCLDDEGNLWIAEDRGKALLRFNGALQGLSDRLRRKASPR
jgi:sugar lactone lactonase YvrE